MTSRYLRSLCLIAAVPMLACQSASSDPGGPNGPAGGKADGTEIEDGVPFIDETTFANGTGCGFERDGSELEATFTVNGMDGKELREILVSPDEDRPNRSVFQRLRKNRTLEAFTYGYNLNEIPWSGRKHRTREDFPFVTLTIEFDRFVEDEDTGERELSLGTDIMDDAYFDTAEFDILDSDMTLRGRTRWDGPGTVRRLLVAAKFNTTVDANGIKRSEKVDTRTTGSANAFRGTLIDDVRSGEVPWCGSRQAIEPIKVVYDKLAELDLLPDLEDPNGVMHRGVMLVAPKVHLRSTRSRLHYDFAQFSDVRKFYTNGLSRLESARDAAQDALNDPDFADRYPSAAAAAAGRDRINAVIDMADDLSSGDLIEQRVQSVDSSITNVTLPAQFPQSVNSFEALEANRVTSEVASDLFHDFADVLDDADRDISGAPINGSDAADAFDDLGEIFIEWQDDRSRALAKAQTMGAHITDYRGLSDGLRRDFADFYDSEIGNDPDKVDPMDDDVWDMLENQLKLESLKISQNMLEAGGTSARGMWFEQAREFYVPNSNRPFGNFLIDTIDMTEIITPAAWADLDPGLKDDVDELLPSDAVEEAMLVNEVQIELALEKPYLARINELQERIDNGSATAEDRRDLEGAQFVFDTLLSAQQRVAEVKERQVVRTLERNGAPDNVLEWEPVEQSKGQRALNFVR